MTMPTQCLEMLMGPGASITTAQRTEFYSTLVRGFLAKHYPSRTHMPLTPLRHADEARAQSARATTPSIDSYLVKLNRCIEAVAAGGGRSINYPFDKIDLQMSDEVDASVRDRIRIAVEAAGYTWEHKDSQDPGSVMDRPIDIIRW